jgi:hypothetical protein
MTASAITRMQHVLTAWLCLAVLTAAWVMGPSDIVAHHPSAAMTQQMVAVYAVTPTHRPCSFAHLLQSAGTCASVNHVGLGQWTADEVAPPEPKASRLPLPQTFSPTAFHGSRLDRPPRA